MKSNKKQAKKANNNINKTKTTTTKKPSTGGLDEIDTLFAQKKQSDKQLQQQITQDKEQAKLERRKRKQARLEEEREELSLRGGTCVAVVGSGNNNNNGSSSAPESLHNKARKLTKLSYTRSDLEELNDNSKSERKDQWASDGMGGIFNGEGFTGRTVDGGRVFKAHLMNREGFGQSVDCPFDCQCCFI